MSYEIQPIRYDLFIWEPSPQAWEHAASVVSSVGEKYKDSAIAGLIALEAARRGVRPWVAAYDRFAKQWIGTWKGDRDGTQKVL